MSAQAFQGPGIFTDQAYSPERLLQLVKEGYEWISYQVQNGNSVVDFDLQPAKSAGFKNVGVWGVSYSAAEIPVDARNLGAQAKKLGAQHQMADLEEFFKDTRGVKVGTTGKTLGQIYVDNVRAGRQSTLAMVDFTTLGSPTDPVNFDYVMDTDPFKNSGGACVAQAYAVEAPEYTPFNAIAYWSRFFPLNAINIAIGLYEKNGIRFDGPANVPLLRQAGARRNISLFMGHHATDADLQALEPFSTVVDPSAQRQKIVQEADAWLLQQVPPQAKSRLRAIRRIAATEDTDPLWIAARDSVISALDAAGIPQ